VDWTKVNQNGESCEDMVQIHLTQDRGQWQALVNTNGLPGSTTRDEFLD
jgi:hypothetical protein